MIKVKLLFVCVYNNVRSEDDKYLEMDINIKKFGMIAGSAIPSLISSTLERS